MTKKAEQESAQPTPKDAFIQIRLDAELAARVGVKAQKLGGTSAVIRALLRQWLERDDIVTAEDILAEIPRAPQRKRKPTK